MNEMKCDIRAAYTKVLQQAIKFNGGNVEALSTRFLTSRKMKFLEAVNHFPLRKFAPLVWIMYYGTIKKIWANTTKPRIYLQCKYVYMLITMNYYLSGRFEECAFDVCNFEFRHSLTLSTDGLEQYYLNA